MQDFKYKRTQKRENKQQNDRRCNMLARMKLEDEGITMHGRNARLK